MRAALMLCLPLALAACGHHDRATTTTSVHDDGTTRTETSTVSGLNIDTDKFKANIDIPGLSFGGDAMDLDGMKLYPGSKVRGVRINAVDRGTTKKGEVTVTVASPAAPAIVAAHMAAEARKAGFTVATPTPTSVSGTKRDDDEDNRFVMAFAADGAGSSGQITLTGAGHRSGW